MGDSPYLADKASKQIAEMIFRYELCPGSKISDFTLAKKIGISRTPVRQAIMSLVNKGLIIVTDDGYRVVEISTSKIDELYDARVCLETSILAFAIEKGISDEDVDKLGSLLEEKKMAFNSNDLLKSLDYDMEYHKFIIELSHNKRLEDSFIPIYTYMKLINVLALVNPNKETNLEYTQIFDSIKKRDATKACEILRQSIEKGRRQKKEVIGRFGVDGLGILYNFIATRSKPSITS